MIENDFIIEDIDVIEQLEDFQDEYVYDIEVEDTHTFFGNDILVHNSIYVEFGRLTKFLNIPVKDQTKFVVTLWQEGCGPYMDKMYDEYAKAYNCDQNLENLELEKVCRTALLYAKKHYAMEEVWEEPGVYLKDMEEIVYKGLEVVQGSTPPYARKCQKDMIEFVLKAFIKDEKPTYQALIDRLKKYKEEMKAQPIDDIAKGASIGDYEKFILDDKQSVKIDLHTPIHVKASAYYNHMLLTNKKFLSKYSRLKTGEKCKWYYADHIGLEVFAFAPNSYPIEFAPKMNYDKQFETTILNPINKLIAILGYDPLSVSLCFSDALF
jgi:intein/homing endonuclease